MKIREIMERRQSLAFALRVLLGYPRHQPVANPLAFAGAGPINPAMKLQLSRVAADLGQDLVVLHHHLESNEITSISLAIRTTDAVSVFTDGVVYAVSETAPLQILAGGQAWRLAERNMLIGRRAPPSKRVARGVDIANGRWRTAAEALGPVQLDGGRFVPKGGTLMTALDTEAAILAAAA